MKIIVKVKTKSKTEKIERVGQEQLPLMSQEKDIPVYKLSVKEVPVAGRANEAVIKLLAKYFDISPGRIKILSGQKSKQKVFEIL